MTAEISGNVTAAKEPAASSVSSMIEEAALAIAIVALGVIMVVGAMKFDGGAGYQVIGPAVFPLIVGMLSLICGAALSISKVSTLVLFLRGRFNNRAAEPVDSPAVVEPNADPIGWRRVTTLAMVLIGYALLLTFVGFWQMTGLVFALAAKIFGSRKFVRNIIIGYVLALAVYFLFDRVLGVGLPDGYIRIAG